MVEPARGPHVRTDAPRGNAARRSISPPLHALSDIQFEDVLLKNAHPPVRDPQIWSELTSPALIGRSRQTLISMHARNSGAIQRRKARLTEFHADCVAQGPAGHPAWLRAKADYENWKLGAANFGRTVSAALAEINDIEALRSQTVGSAGRLQAQLNYLLNAIRAHRTASDDANVAPEPHDITLWESLESIAGSGDLVVQGRAVGH